MKDQYFGDINDFKKFGLLRSISSASNLSILIAWMLTEDDGSTDGKFIQYLREPEMWEHYDPPLYCELVRLLSQKAVRKVSFIEDSDILNGCCFYSKHIPDSAQDRTTWFRELTNVSKDSDLVFLDPDNGLEISSKPYGRKNSSKFLYWREVASLWAAGKSLLIYQHFIREKRAAFIHRMLRKLSEHTINSVVAAFYTSNVVFLLALQPVHAAYHIPIVNSVNNKWSAQIQCWGKK